jgi:hypothetical protein
VLEILFDDQGLIYKIEDNGERGYGDSCAETARYYHLKFMRHLLGIDAEKPATTEAWDVLSKFFFRNSYLGMRAPVHLLPPEWGDPIKDFSADQQDPLVMALGAYGLEDIVEKIREEQRRRFWFYQNGDLPRTYTANIFKRSRREDPSWFGDAGIMGTVLARCGKLPFWDSGTHEISFGNPKDVADTLNLVHKFFQCEYAGHTSSSRYAKDYYSRNVFETFGTSKLGVKNKILGAIALYYTKDNPGLVQLYEPVIYKVFGE